MCGPRLIPLLIVVCLQTIGLKNANCFTTYPTTTQHKTPFVQQLTAPFWHGEGPHWDSAQQALLFVDIAGQRVYRYEPYSKLLTYAHIGDTVGMIVPLMGSKNKYIIGKGTDLTLLEWNGNDTTSPRMQRLTAVDKDKPGNRFNDGKADALGRLWIGTMGEEKPIGNVAPNRGSLYRISNHSCQLDPMITGVSISNGMAWSLNNEFMYYIDSPTKRVEKFDYDLLNATISNQRTLIDFTKENIRGIPDGMTIDKAGNLWIACWGGYQIINVDSTSGKVINSIQMPVERVTSLTFGGYHYDTLFVTSMRIGLTEQEIERQPAAGALFSVSNVPITGLYNVPAAKCADILNF